MVEPVLLTIDGDVEQPTRLTLADLAAMDSQFQVLDIGQLDHRRKGGAVQLAGVLALARPKPSATYLTLHASADDFHASVPLAAVVDRGLVVYRLADESLPVSLGGPVRFFIPNFATCHTDDVDECANVKFVDRIELSASRGRDNRPHDMRAHYELHQQPTSATSEELPRP